MPLYKTIQHNSNTQILIWNITESFEQLNQEVQLNEKNQLRLNGMKSEMHQRAFLSVRKLLLLAGYSDFNLQYDEFGKPHLVDDNYISITHSHHFSAIIVSKEPVGIDIEMQRNIILKIAHKFVNEEELNRLQKTDLNDFIKKLAMPVASSLGAKSPSGRYHFGSQLIDPSMIKLANLVSSHT